jgi:heterodisulfide reductase subunit A2
MPPIFYMDMRTYGKEFERYYNRAKDEQGVRFIRSRVHSIEPAEPGSDDLRIEYVDESGQVHGEVFDMVVLSVGLTIEERPPLDTYRPDDPESFIK